MAVVVSRLFFCVGLILISSLSFQSIHHSPDDGSNYLSALTSLLIRRLLIRLVDCGPLLSSGYIRDVDLHTDWMFASRVNAHRPTKSIRGNGNNLRAHWTREWYHFRPCPPHIWPLLTIKSWEVVNPWLHLMADLRDPYLERGVCAAEVNNAIWKYKVAV